MIGSAICADGPLSSDLSLLSLNYEYLLPACFERSCSATLRKRMGQIELDVAALYPEARIAKRLLSMGKAWDKARGDETSRIFNTTASQK